MESKAYARFAPMNDARRQQMEYERLIADLNGVAGVVAALVTRDDIEVLGKQINNLAFAFIAPLGTDDYDDFGHGRHQSAVGSSSRQYLLVCLAVRFMWIAGLL